MNDLAAKLSLDLPGLPVTADADMGGLTSFCAGGRADCLAEPSGREELARLLAWLHKNETPFLILGNGSNLLFRDGGFRGVVLRIGENFSDLSVEGCRLTAGAGASLAAASRKAAEASLAGLEFASGIPGSVGGGAYMNAGAYGGEFKDVLESVEVMTRDGSRTESIPVSGLDYGYRWSRLMETGDIILSAIFKLTPGSREDILAAMKDLTRRRNEKQPMDLPSAGSFFKRPIGYFAGKLIQDAGLAGLSLGGAQVSPKHCGFIVNTGNATASDITGLMRMVQAAVLEDSGVLLEPEVRIVGEEPR
jgi:UDP-N-acetylmuramate dehydrogenase